MAANTTPSPSPYQHTGALTDPGCKREQNQDTLHVDEAAGLWIVADGMGGHHGGEIASAIACQVIPAQVAKGATLEAALHTAHQAILARAEQEPQLTGMGATIVVAHAQGDQLELAWSGDSRAYRWRDGQLTRLSQDHSVVDTLIRSGLITPQQARVHPQVHVVSTCLGTTNAKGLQVGYYQELWQPEDRILLCSDGLTDELDDPALATLMAQHSTPQAVAQALLDAALAAGGRDNVSVVVISAPGSSDATHSTAARFRPPVALPAGVWGIIGAALGLALVVAIKYLNNA